MVDEKFWVENRAGVLVKVWRFFMETTINEVHMGPFVLS